MIKDPVWVRTKMGAELRSGFKQVLKGTKYSTSEAIRLFMRKTIELGPKEVRKACVDVARSLRKSVNSSDCEFPVNRVNQGDLRKSNNPGNEDHAANSNNLGNRDHAGNSNNRNNRDDPDNSTAR